MTYALRRLAQSQSAVDRLGASPSAAILIAHWRVSSSCKLEKAREASGSTSVLLDPLFQLMGLVGGTDLCPCV